MFIFIYFCVKWYNEFVLQIASIYSIENWRKYNEKLKKIVKFNGKNDKLNKNKTDFLCVKSFPWVNFCHIKLIFDDFLTLVMYWNEHYIYFRWMIPKQINIRLEIIEFRSVTNLWIKHEKFWSIECIDRLGTHRWILCKVI